MSEKLSWRIMTELYDRLWARLKYSKLGSYFPKVVERIISHFYGELMLRNKYATNKDFKQLNEEWLEPYLSMNDNHDFVDIGAYAGEYSVKMAFKAKNVYAFEPHPMMYNVLKERIKAVTNVKCFPYAIGGEDKLTKFYMDDWRTEESHVKRNGLNFVVVKCVSLDSLDKKGFFKSRVGSS